MKITIITVCLNSEKTIRKTLESIKNQTYKNTEIIIVDGASTDNTLKIVAEYRGIITTIVSQKDNGIFDAMNKGISLATGSFVFFLNSDDSFYDNKVLEDVIENLELNPEADLLYGNIVPGEDNKITKQTFSHINKKNISFEHLCHQAVFARLTLFQDIGGFNLKFKTNSDYDWIIRVFRSGAKCIWFDRIISVFSLGGMHAKDRQFLEQEHKAVRLQYMSRVQIFYGDVIRRFRHRWHRTFNPYPLGITAMEDKISIISVIILSHGFQAEYELGFANGLARNGVAVTLIGSNETLVERLEPSVNLLNLRGSQDDKRPKWRKLYDMLRYWILCYSYVLFNRKTPVHVIGVFKSPWQAIIECWLTRLIAKKFILTIHDILPHDQHTALNAKLNKIAFRAANISVIHANPMRLILTKEFGIDSESIVMIDVGTDRLLPMNLEDRQRMRARFGIKENESVILFFGNILHYKGVDILINAFNMIANKNLHRLLIVGRCNNHNLKQELKSMINDSKFSSKIFWYEGFFPEDEVASIFHAADVLVMPYRHIYQSGVIFMALATGLRTVASDVGVLKEYIPTKFGRIVPPENPSALAKGIEQILVQVKPPQEYFQNLAKPYLWSETVRPLLKDYSN